MPSPEPPRDVGASLLVVVPTLNEAGSLGELVERFFSANPQADLLVVDDASPDGTADLCRSLQPSFPGLHLLERKAARGLGSAYVAGFQHGLAGAWRWVGTMDADLSHDPAVIPLMLVEGERDGPVDRVDVVIGSRYTRDGGTINWRLRRILLSWLANRYASWLLGVGARDMTSGFRLYRTAALRRIDLAGVTSTGYSFLVEVLHLLVRSGALVAEVPIVFVDRTMGESKLGSREIFLGAWHLMRMRFRNGGFAATDDQLGAPGREKDPLG